MGSADLWVKAASQIFFSLGLCFGGVIAFASYNPVDQDLLRDSTIVASINSGTSIYGTITNHLTNQPN